MTVIVALSRYGRAVTRRDALRGAAAVAATGAVPVAATAKSEPDAELIALGQQWQEANDEWLRACDAVEIAYAAGEPSRRVRDLEKVSDVPFERAWALKDQIAEIPARSANGAVVKLRIVVAQNRITDENDDVFGRLTNQALQALEVRP